MSTYRLILGTSSGLPAEKRKKIAEKVQTLIAGADGKVGEIKHRGMTKIAYPIAKETEMDLAVICFEAPEKAIKSLQKEFGKINGILRAMVIREGVKG